jgi:hypothetical protein
VAQHAKTGRRLCGFTSDYIPVLSLHPARQLTGATAASSWGSLDCGERAGLPLRADRWLHRHGDALTHAHAHLGPHTHDGEPSHADDRIRTAHGHTHGLVDPTIRRSRAGLRAVSVSLAVLGVTAALQAAIYVITGSVALLADLIHNFGDALTAVPLGAAFVFRSPRAERYAGFGVVLAIFVSACVAGAFAVMSPAARSCTQISRGVRGTIGYSSHVAPQPCAAMT